MDANIGGSSGGHLAVLLDDTVYHFQYSADEIFTLNREKPEQFYEVYNQNENRSIETTPLRLESAAVDSIRTRLDSYFLVQQKYIRLLSWMKQDAEFLEKLSQRQSIAVDHTAYFVPAAKCAADSSHEMRDSAAWARTIGPDLLSKRADADAKPLPEPFVLQRSPVAPDVFPEAPASYSQLLSEKIQTDRLASVLREPHCPGSDFLTTNIEIDAGARAALEVILVDLRKSARSLWLSQRPDRAGALLLTMARIVAVETSLKRNQLTMLDTTPPEHMTGDRDNLLRFPDYGELPARARSICHGILLTNVASEDWSRQLNLLENCVTRYYELARTDSPLVRFYQGNMSPRGAGLVDYSAASAATGDEWFQNNPSASESLVRQARQAYGDFQADIQKTYSFNLIAKNCATELLREIVRAFASEEEAVAALGGNLYPSANFIPALASRQAGRLHTSEAPRMRPSKRLAMLEKMYESSHRLLRPVVYLRESNVASSTLYSTKDEDSMFLFFTDDALILRPVYGVLNVSYGLVQAGLGCARIPWDGGTRLKSGVRGVLFSLPELAFFNIRKGSYPVP